MNLQEFEELLKSHTKPVIVDIWAPWCMPCRSIKPILESLAKEYNGKVDLLVINADEHPQLLGELGIYGIPTVMATQSGEILKKVAGAQSQEYYSLIFESLAGTDVSFSIPMSGANRFLRLAAGSALALVGLSLDLWLLIAAGAIIGFLGVYDRCPIWKAVTSRFNKWTP